ncbi:MAG: hypothetical protein ACLU6O_03215 [Bilophila wadsworthia]
MELTVDMSVPASVEIGATGLRGLAQEIRTALATRKGSVPSTGISACRGADRPAAASQGRLVAEIGRGWSAASRASRSKRDFRTDTSGAADGS